MVRHWRSRFRCVSVWPSGEGHEDVVEARALQREAGDALALGIELVEEAAHIGRGAVGGDADGQRRSLRACRSSRQVIADLIERGGVGQMQFQPLFGDLVLELVGGALGDDRAPVEHRDAVGQRVGLLEILRGQNTVTPRRSAGSRSPTSPAGCGGQDRSSARRGTRPRVGRSGSRPGPGVGACRPSRSRHGGRRPRRGRTARASRVRGLSARPSRIVSSRPIISRFSRPVCTLVDRRVLAGEADPAPDLAALCDDVVAGDPCACPRRAAAAWPGSGRSSSCRRRSGRAARTRCRATREIDAVQDEVPDRRTCTSGCLDCDSSHIMCSYLDRFG